MKERGEERPNVWRSKGHCRLLSMPPHLIPPPPPPQRSDLITPTTDRSFSPGSGSGSGRTSTLSRRTLGLSITSSALKVSPQGSKLEPFPSEVSRQKLSRLPHKGRNGEHKEDRRVFTCSHFENFLLKTPFLVRSPSLEFGRQEPRAPAPPPRRQRTISPFRCPTLCDTQTSVSSVKGQRFCSLLLPRGNTDPGWQDATGHAPCSLTSITTPPRRR